MPIRNILVKNKNAYLAYDTLLGFDQPVMVVNDWGRNVVIVWWMMH
jgi:hypothetical protein